ncbi:hypothetical protein GALMADRAFT_226851 [Galerina marginata CBS 339.88]|uniref:Uncharacterized protein n=1 Tax=Galerina marginata (strain CBS 339.88) TaxID=685588 RepID=A0A067SW69_GALM3|nr:hypothetical protein GALMADRAFT_226851 [Galerina marginata CBS 339.88]
MEAALSQPSSSQEGELQPEPSTSSQRPRFKPAAQNAISDIPTLLGSQNEGGGSGTFAPKTPTRLQYSSTLAPSPSLPGTPVRQQINSRLASTMGSEIGSPGTLPDGNLKELTADSIADMLQQLSRVPEYIRKLESSEKKRRAADKSREAKESKIKKLEDEVEGLKAREKELEAVIAEYERQDSD